MRLRAILHASLSIVVTEYLIGHFAASLIFHEIYKLHKLAYHSVLLFSCFTCLSLNHWQSFDRARHVVMLITVQGRSLNFIAELGQLIVIDRHVLDRVLSHSRLVKITFVVVLVCDVAKWFWHYLVKLVIFLDLFERLGEELADILLLEAGGAANARVAAVVEHRFRDFGHARLVSLLFLLLMLGHDVGQVDIALIGHLAGVLQRVHLLNLALQLQLLRIYAKTRDNSVSIRTEMSKKGVN